MKKGNSNKSYLVFLIVAGALLGTFLGDALGNKFRKLDFLKVVYTIGTPKDLVIDIKFLYLTFGLNLYVNIMTIIGIILAIMIYRKY